MATDKEEAVIKAARDFIWYLDYAPLTRENKARSVEIELGHLRKAVREWKGEQSGEYAAMEVAQSATTGP
jgi:hypothetical protein